MIWKNREFREQMTWTLFSPKCTCKAEFPWDFNLENGDAKTKLLHLSNQRSHWPFYCFHFELVDNNLGCFHFAKKSVRVESKCLFCFSFIQPVKRHVQNRNKSQPFSISLHAQGLFLDHERPHCFHYMHIVNKRRGKQHQHKNDRSVSPQLLQLLLLHRSWFFILLFQSRDFCAKIKTNVYSNKFVSSTSPMWMNAPGNCLATIFKT